MPIGSFPWMLFLILPSKMIATIWVKWDSSDYHTSMLYSPYCYHSYFLIKNLPHLDSNQVEWGVIAGKSICSSLPMIYLIHTAMMIDSIWDWWDCSNYHTSVLYSSHYYHSYSGYFYLLLIDSNLVDWVVLIGISTYSSPQMLHLIHNSIMIDPTWERWDSSDYHTSLLYSPSYYHSYSCFFYLFTIDSNEVERAVLI
jgi:hypothetical protein